MGWSDTFGRAITSFSLAYADQAEKDHGALERAVRKGKVNAVFEDPKLGSGRKRGVSDAGRNGGR
jgi:hypothetical protein